jgi:hypothetical protein
MVEPGAIVRLGASAGHVIVATAAPDGLPHVASARQIDSMPDGRLRVTEWFCPGTMANLQHNRSVSLVVWDSVADAGYQVLGEVEEVRDLAILDGVAAGPAPLPAVPQVERELILRVSQVLEFRQAPHTDVPV